jgi:hypothetical protein
MIYWHSNWMLKNKNKLNSTNYEKTSIESLLLFSQPKYRLKTEHQ